MASGDIVVMRATLDVVLDVADRLREADREELALASGKDIRENLADCFRDSRMTMAASAGGVPFAVFGAADSQHSTGGVPWGVGTDDADRMPIAVMRIARHWMSVLDPFYPFLFNLIHVGNARSLRLVRSLGFSVEAPLAYGPSGAMFHPVRRWPDV